MLKLNQRGALSALLVPLILSVLLLVVAIVFGGWAFSSRQDYKFNVDKKIEQASAVAVEKAKTEKDNEFVEKEKQPLKDYRTPTDYGNLLIKYPKTWSAYVDETGTSDLVDGYFHPGFVPHQNAKPSYALRLKISNQKYDDELKRKDGQVRTGKIKVTPFRATAVPGVLGARLDGEIAQGKQGSMVMLPLRDRTIIIWTETQEFVGDFDNFVLANLSFSP